MGKHRELVVTSIRILPRQRVKHDPQMDRYGGTWIVAVGRWKNRLVGEKKSGGEEKIYYRRLSWKQEETKLSTKYQYSVILNGKAPKVEIDEPFALEFLQATFFHSERAKRG